MLSVPFKVPSIVVIGPLLCMPLPSLGRYSQKMLYTLRIDMVCHIVTAFFPQSFLHL